MWYCGICPHRRLTRGTCRFPCGACSGWLPGDGRDALRRGGFLNRMWCVFLMACVGYQKCRWAKCCLRICHKFTVVLNPLYTAVKLLRALLPYIALPQLFCRLSSKCEIMAVLESSSYYAGLSIAILFGYLLSLLHLEKLLSRLFRLLLPDRGNGALAIHKNTSLEKDQATQEVAPTTFSDWKEEEIFELERRAIFSKASEPSLKFQL